MARKMRADWEREDAKRSAALREQMAKDFENAASPLPKEEPPSKPVSAPVPHRTFPGLLLVVTFTLLLPALYVFRGRFRRAGCVYARHKRTLLTTGAVVVLFSYFVWPTPWKVETMGFSLEDLMRTNRVTGTKQFWVRGHWAYIHGWQQTRDGWQQTRDGHP